jgi:uncharacterized protein
MKRTGLFLLFVLGFVTSCTNQAVKETSPEITKGDTCSITLSGVEFTKSLNGADTMATIDGDRLILTSAAKRDNFNDPDGKLSNSTAPVLLKKVDNSKPFTFVARVAPTFKETYDAGTLYVYLNPKLWFKFAFERDERMRTRIVTVRTIDTSDDNNHDVITNPNVYMKITSDVETIGFYYSLDKKTWQLVRLFKNDYPAEIWVGMSAQSPIGEGTSVTFDDCSFAETAIADFRSGI